MNVYRFILVNVVWLALALISFSARSEGYQPNTPEEHQTQDQLQEQTQSQELLQDVLQQVEIDVHPVFNIDTHEATQAAAAPVNVTTNDAGLSLVIENEEQAPSMFSPSVYPTAPCINSGSFAGSSKGFGISFGGGKELDGCVNRELIRLAAQMGRVDHALFMLCSQEETIMIFGSVETCLGFRTTDTASVISELRSDLAICEEAGARRQEEFVECLSK